jgi:hypothetical protein
VAEPLPKSSLHALDELEPCAGRLLAGEAYGPIPWRILARRQGSPFQHVRQHDPGSLSERWPAMRGKGVNTDDKIKRFDQLCGLCKIDGSRCSIDEL